MPAYKYRCRYCGAMSERLRGIDDSDDDVGCPRCGRSGPQRVFAAFSRECSYAPAGPTRGRAFC